MKSGNTPHWGAQAGRAQADAQLPTPWVAQNRIHRYSGANYLHKGDFLWGLGSVGPRHLSAIHLQARDVDEAEQGC